MSTKKHCLSFSAKSIWIHCHGLPGYAHGCSCATAGTLQLFTFSSISLSIPGHHMWLRASAFIWRVPGYSWCRYSNSLSLFMEGATMHRPPKTQPLSSDSSCLHMKFGFSPSSVTQFVQQFNICIYTLLSIGSFAVACTTYFAHTGSLSMKNLWKIDVSFFCSVVLFSFWKPG